MQDSATDPLWYKDAVIYQLHVKTFRDTDMSGMGDFKGLLQKLDYLEDLGVNIIWLLPFYPSPGRDDGYDTADYRNVHPAYGTLRDFRAFLRAAHQRGIRIITELVMNHTSDQHAWFQRARNAPPGSRYRNFYVWSDTPDKYLDARIIFTDYETSNWSWDPVAKQYFWHRFYSHQPDLNFESPDVKRMMFKAVDFWLEMGVDGLRLDAVPYLYEREGTNCENLPQTYEFLRELREYIDSRYENRMLLAEANQWPEDAVAYFGKGDICHTAFHFPLMPRMYIALQMEDRFPIIDILDQTPSIPENCQWVIFLRNHDELTLEMVTDEERDYMYRAYARDSRARINVGIRRRLAPLLSNNRKTIELLNVLLFSLPGTPVIYYGDEIGMGDNYYLGDRNGVRTPMQWSPGKNGGFSYANPQKLYLPVIIDPEYHYEAVNVETQQANPASLLWWMKRIIATRKGLRAFGRGSMRFLYPENPKILAFLREYEEETILVVVSLSHASQAVELDLSEFAGTTPVEIFSRNRFPLIQDVPYTLTLGPYGYYWFLLEQEEEPAAVEDEDLVPLVRSTEQWKSMGPDLQKKLESVLTSYLPRCRWFGEKGMTLRKVLITESVPVQTNSGITQMLILEAGYAERGPARYLLPVSFAGPEASGALHHIPNAIVANANLGGREGVLYDAVHDQAFCESLLYLIARKRKHKGDRGEVSGLPASRFNRLLDERGLDLEARVLRGEQSNTSILYEDAFIMKLYRKLEEGVNPDIEINRHLTESVGFHFIPPYAGSIIYQARVEEAPICLLQGFVQNEGDAWKYTLSSIDQFFAKVLTRSSEEPELEDEYPVDYTTDFDRIPQEQVDTIGGFFLEMMGLLGTRTAQMHSTLARRSSDTHFAPEGLSALYLRSLYQSMRSQTRRTLSFLRRQMHRLPGELKDQARMIASFEPDILEKQRRLMGRKMDGLKTRTHGDYHLGQVLFTGKDFIIIDFEGEPARPLSERRIKRPPLRDVAGMMRSFHYAVQTVFLEHIETRPEDTEELEPWVELWYRVVSGLFLHSYLETALNEEYLPRNKADRSVLLEAFLMEKALYELMYELNNRPDWAAIPLQGLDDLLKAVD